MSTRGRKQRNARTGRLAVLAALAGTLVAGLPAGATPTGRVVTVEVWDATETTRLSTYQQSVTTEAFRRFSVAVGGWNDPGSGLGSVAIDDLTVGFSDGSQWTSSFATAPTIVESTTGGTNDALTHDLGGQRLLAWGDSGYACSTNYESVDVGSTEITSARFTVNRTTGDIGDGSYWDIWAGLTPSDNEPIVAATCGIPDPTGWVDNLVGVRMEGDGDGVRRNVAAYADGTQSTSGSAMTIGVTYVVRITVASSNFAPVATLIAPAANASLPFLGTSGGSQWLSLRGTDPDSGAPFYGTAYLRRARTGAVAKQVPIPLTPSGNLVNVDVGKLEPGAWTWSVVLTDVYGASSSETPPIPFTVGPLAYTDGVYVALGDSYSSGEGAAPNGYESGTDTETNKCHRSALSYPRRVSTDSGMPTRMVFGACSGDETKHLYRNTRYDEPFQFDRLTPDTTLVTMSIGGNDSGFADVLQGCIFQVGSSCVPTYDDLVARRFARLNADRFAPISASDLAVDPGVAAVEPLAEVYHRLRQAAPHARVLIVGYPRFFQQGGAGYLCAGIQDNEQEWMNDKVRQINDIVETRAREAGFEYVDVENALDGHEICTGDSWMNPLQLPPEAFHPTADGHAAEATVLRSVLASNPATAVNVCQGCSTTVTRTVPAGQKKLTASIRWPGGDVTLRLRSPSGRVFDRQNGGFDVVRDTQLASEVVTVTNPEAGSWFVDLIGNDVSPNDQAQLTWYTHPSINTLPNATFTYSYDGISTVSVDGGASSDSDGSVVELLYDFGDGITGYDATAMSHRYAPGTYTITLQARDDMGGTSYAYSNPITVWGYSFYGFTSPMSAPPALNRVSVNKQVKLKYSIKTHDGATIVDPSSFLRVISTQVNCDGSPSANSYTTSTDAAPTYGNGQWTYYWTPSASWSGTCRRMELELNDKVTGVSGGRYLLFDFR